MENIIRGTTPSLIVDFTDIMDVSTITDAVLTIRTRAQTPASTDDVVLVDPTTNEGKIINYKKLAPGVIPSGGTAGQFLVKSSSTDYDTEWVTLQTWSGGSY